MGMSLNNLIKKSKIIYSVECLNCEKTYIGKTIRHFCKIRNIYFEIYFGEFRNKNFEIFF
jgi:hypothetical protein